MNEIRQKEAEYIIFIITWSGIFLCGYWLYTYYINAFIIIIVTIIIGSGVFQRPSCEYRLIPVVLSKFMFATVPVDHG